MHQTHNMNQTRTYCNQQLLGMISEIKQTKARDQKLEIAMKIDSQSKDLTFNDKIRNSKYPYFKHQTHVLNMAIKDSKQRRKTDISDFEDGFVIKEYIETSHIPFPHIYNPVPKLKTINYFLDSITRFPYKLGTGFYHTFNT